MSEKDTESKVTDAVRAMAKTIGKAIEVDKKGFGSEKEPVYEKTLPEDLPIEVVEKVSDHNSTFIAAGALAFGEAAIKVLQKHDDIAESNIKLSMAGKDHVEYNLQRHREFTNHLNGSGETVDRYGVLTAKYAVKGGTSTSGQLKEVRQELLEQGLKALGKK